MEKAVKQNSGAVAEVIKAIIVAVIISLVLILLMGFVIKLANIDDKYLSLINQIIKGVSILVSCLICFKSRSNGWLKGIITGLVYIILAFALFGMLNEFKFNIGLSLLNDAALGAVTGMLSGIISVLFKAKKNY